MGRSRSTLLLIAAPIAALAAYIAVLRPYQLHWGSTVDEIRGPMPGDDVVSRPWMNATRAVTIDAPPSEVWPWLVQMGGYTRAGWYSIDHIDNAGRPSAKDVIAELQQLKVDDILPTAPDGSGFRVEAIEPERLLFLTIRDPRMTISSAFILAEAGPGRTRLINRLRLRPSCDPRAVAFALAMDTGDIFFMARTLLGIKRRAEHRHDPRANLAGTGAA